MNMKKEKKLFTHYLSGKYWVVAPIAFFVLFSTSMLGSRESFAEEVETQQISTKKETSTFPTAENVDVSRSTTELDTVATEHSTSEKVPEQATNLEQPKLVTEETDTGKVETPKAEEKAPEVAPTGNRALDNAVKDAQNNGVVIKEEPEKKVSSKEEADKDFNQQENTLKDTTNAQKEIDKTINNAVDKAKENGVAVKETEKQTYKDQLKALEDAKKQELALEEAAKVMNEANKLIEDTINKAKQNGTPVKDGGILHATVKDAMEKAKQLVSSIQEIDSENAEIKQRNADALAKYEKVKAELDAKNAKIKAQNEAIAKRNKERQDLYNKFLKEYLNGTKLETKMDARTQSYNEQEQYKTLMNSEVDQKTGKFTLTHDMNDGLKIFGRGILTGKINWLVTSNGDGSENVVINSIDLFKYIYTNLKPNSAVNKNIRFVVRDLQGNEIFRLNHDGERTISRTINKNVKYNNVKYRLKAGESTKMVEFLKVDDLWIYNTYGQVMIQFKNANEKPKTPDLEQKKLLDTTKLTQPTPEELKEAVSKKIVVTEKVHAVKLQTAVHSVKVVKKPVLQPKKTVAQLKKSVTQPKKPVNTPSKPVKVPEKLTVEKASVVPELPKTGEKENTLLSVLGAGMLVGLAWFGLKKNKGLFIK